MNKHLSLLFAAVIAASATATAAVPVILFGPDGSKLNQCETVSRIEISNGNFILVPSEGATNASTPISSTGYLSLNPADLTGVADITALTLKLSLTGNELTVTAPSAISALKVYDAAGRTVSSATPGNATASVNIEGHGVFLIQATVNNKVETVKIVK